jgi:hypothetical protein
VAILLSTCLPSSRTIADSLQRATTTPKREEGFPLWRAELRSAIGDGPLGLISGRGRETRGKPYASLWFLDNNTIAATFVVRKGEPTVSSRHNSDQSLALQLRVVFIDATTGKVTGIRSWPTESRFSSIVATRDGSFVVQRGTELTLFSSDLKEVKTLESPTAPDAEWHTHTSPSGKSILLVPTNLQTHSVVPWVWIDAESLTVVRSWKEVQSGWVSISDREIAMTTCVWLYDCDSKIEVRGISEDWKTIGAVDKRNKPRPRLINDETLFLLGSPTRITRTDGEMLFVDDKQYESCWWGDALPTATGLRFAVPACALRGAIPTLDLGGTEILRGIVLYDSPFHGPSYVLELKGPRIKDLSQLAISPDGTKLAILNGLSVQGFRLPAPH